MPPQVEYAPFKVILNSETEVGINGRHSSVKG